jgi:hypothetical protein
MAKVKIQGHASGTGILTVTAPDTDENRTITLPDATGTLLNSDGSAASLTSIPAANITGTLPAIDGSNLTGVGGGAWTFLKSITETNVASITLVNDASSVIFDEAYIAYELWGFNVRGVTNDRQVWLRASTDTGSTYESSGYTSGYRNIYDGTNSGPGSRTGELFAFDATGTGAGEMINFRCTFYNPAQTTSYSNMTFEIVGNRHSAAAVYQNGSGILETVGNIDGLQLIASAGNITCDYLKLYGLSGS